jgi:hypothetical protein
MVRRILGTALICLASYAGLVHAQARKTIHVRVFNGKTGEQIKPNILMVRINHLGTNHSDWVHKNYDGSVDVRLPEDAGEVAIQATYDASTEVYINCDAAREHNTSDLHWYKVAEILKAGTIAPNTCKRARHAEMPDLEAKPGEFVLFVRERNWHEEN